MFGGLYADGMAPDPETVLDRAGWWTEIFETPCIAVAHAVDQIDPLLATGAEFLGLESALWIGQNADVAGIQAQIRAAGETAA
jgi:thiamine-phosphate pyrophosphorylase